jgi:hypothetical protein
MKIFLSWSGKRSFELSNIIYKWIRSVLPFVHPWQSDKDIMASERWTLALAQELELSSFGIICITPENVNAPWINFEAGAIGKFLNNRVLPLLLDIEYCDLSEPFQQFQSVKTEKKGLHKLITSIYRHANHDEKTSVNNITQRFNNSWPKIESKLNHISKICSSSLQPFDRIYPCRADIIDWDAFNNRVSSMYWACGTSLAPINDRSLIDKFIKRNVTNIKILLPHTDPRCCSCLQLLEYNRVHKVGRKQEEDADSCYNSLVKNIEMQINRGRLSGHIGRYLRRYHGTMYSNITISEKEAFISFYDQTGSGDENITLHASKILNTIGYERIKRDFLNMWNANKCWGFSH